MNPYTPPGGPPQGELPNPEIYSIMGEDNIFLMIEDFYHELEKSSIRHLFSQDMPAASRRSAAFFIQVLGGPSLYSDLYGPPRMRARHQPFRIDQTSRDVWLECFRAVLQEAPRRYAFPAEHLPGFVRWLEEFSAWMVNTAE